MRTVRLFLAALLLVSVSMAWSQEPAAVPAEPAVGPVELQPVFVSDNCFIRCDNGISVDGWEASCESCLAIAIQNCNQQGTYGGWMQFTGWPSCSYIW